MNTTRPNKLTARSSLLFPGASADAKVPTKMTAMVNKAPAGTRRCSGIKATNRLAVLLHT